jgi:hypothetical protein
MKKEGAAMTAKKTPDKKETLYNSEWVSWERVPTNREKAWVQQLKFHDRWLFVVTDESGHNYRDCSNDEDCYRLIENAFPVTQVIGNRSKGAIEVSQLAAKITI